MAAITHISDSAVQAPDHSGGKRSGSSVWTAKNIFFFGLLISASGVVSPAIALASGLAYGLLVEHPLRSESHSLSKLLLQASVVALGFGMDLRQIVRAGRDGVLYTAISIAFAIVLGLILGRALRVKGKASFLITAGTAICGGSAIAALAPICDADEEEISVSMGTVFLLNSVALLIFPAIGTALHFSQNQFGLWAALAIHDTSSVVGAAAKYGSQALAVGTTIKLTRALWIIPVSLITATYIRRLPRKAGDASVSSGSITIPWFILLFCMAAAASTYLPRLAPAFAMVNHLGRIGLTATLFLIGTSLSKRTVRQVGMRPLVQGVVLWIVVGVLSALAIHAGWISL